jgi:LmbE family N-acetylglucosaminyl deacetylase
MIDLSLTQQGRALNVLCLGAHSDDIEIGCGGSVLKLTESSPSSEFTWVVLSSNDQRKAEAEDSAAAFLAGAGKRNVVIKSFRDGFFPFIGGEIKDYFESLKREVSPDLIFTHVRSDLHQDHRLVSDLTWNTFRDHLILEYEVPKYDGDLGRPNVYIHLDERHCREKLETIVTHFRSQAGNHWFTEETFRALLRLRGIESNAASRYAEAFYCRKQVLAWDRGAL